MPRASKPNNPPLMKGILLLLSAGCLALADEPLPTPNPDWSIHLVATAPDIQHPSVVACAPDGRVFVAEDPMDITRPAQVAEGRILCFHPDGRRTVFAEGLHAVFGMQYLEGRLLVLHNPRFTSFKDAGDTGRDPTDLVRQTNPNPWALDWNDHVPANFKLGLDGFLYVAVGDKGLFGAVGTDGRRVDLHGGGIIRIRPDGSGLEVFSTGVRNILDVALTSHDDLFTYDNTDENQWMGRVTHMVDGGFYGYPFDFIPRRPYTLWMMADYGAGAATGTTAHTADGLPAGFRDNLFLADFGQRNIRRVVLGPDGATFTPTSNQRLFPDPPADFRPVGIAFNEDGTSLFICDWQHRDTKEQAVAGRLWKLSWNGVSHAQPRPDWYVPATRGQSIDTPIEELIRALSHRSRSVRLTAQRQLSARGSSAVPALRSLLRDRSASEDGRIHALWALHSIPGTESPAASVPRDAPPALASQALRQAGEARDRTQLAAIRQRLHGPVARIRFHAATALGRIGAPDPIPGLLTSLGDIDPFVRYATFVALRRIGEATPSAWPRIVQGLADPNPLIQQGTAFAFRDTFDATLVQALATVTTNTTLPTSYRHNALDALGGLHHRPAPWDGTWWAYHPFRLPPPPRTNEWAGTPIVVARLSAALTDPEPRLRTTAAVRITQLPPSVGGPLLLARIPTEPDPDVRTRLVEGLIKLRPAGAGPFAADWIQRIPDRRPLPADAIRLARAIGGEAIASALARRLEAQPPASVAVEALGLLGESGATNSTPFLLRLADQADSPVREAALTALARLAGEAAVPTLVHQLQSGSPPVRAAALAALLPLRSTNAVAAIVAAASFPDLRQTATQALLQTPDPRALDLYLEALGSRQATVRSDARRALERLGPGMFERLVPRLQSLQPEVLAELQRLYRTHPAAVASGLMQIETPRPTRESFLSHALANPGDPSRGRVLFEDRSGAGCILCHRVQGNGAPIGPDLSGAGALFDRRTLAESVLWPNRAVREGYNLVQVETTDGDELLGMIRAESAEHLLLQPASGEPVQVPKSRVLKRTGTDQSLMPEGLEGALSLDDFADLIAYLESLRSGT